MPNAVDELLVLGLLIVLNGILTAAETAFVSARPAKLERMAEAGSEGARAAVPLTAHPGRFLGLVQFWLTLICVTAGIALVASAADAFSSLFSKWPALAPWAEGTGLVAATLAVSCTMLLFGELLPKRIALSHPERAAAILGPSMARLLRVVGPLSALIGVASDALALALGFKPRPITESVGDEDVRALVERGLDAGVFKRAKKEMVEGVLSLD
ncbi:MAG TPA: CNNM domain-containing protein, partial [Opitutaceae bacterium]